MKIPKLIALAFLANACAVLPAPAQNPTHEFIFTGTRQSTNDSGRIVTEPVDNHTLIQEALAEAGETDPGGLILVYHPAVGGLDDQVQIFNPNDNGVRPLLRLYFPDAALTNSAQNQYVVYYSVFTEQNDGHAVGSAIVRQRTPVDRKGNALPELNGGTLQYFRTAPNRIYKGSFELRPIEVSP